MKRCNNAIKPVEYNFGAWANEGYLNDNFTCISQLFWCRYQGIVDIQQLGPETMSTKYCENFSLWRGKPCLPGFTRCLGHWSGECASIRSWGKISANTNHGCADNSDKAMLPNSNGKCDEPTWFQCKSTPNQTWCIHPHYSSILVSTVDGSCSQFDDVMGTVGSWEMYRYKYKTKTSKLNLLV